jgi:hypothetical protein
MQLSVNKRQIKNSLMYIIKFVKAEQKLNMNVIAVVIAIVMKNMKDVMALVMVLVVIIAIVNKKKNKIIQNTLDFLR